VTVAATLNGKAKRDRVFLLSLLFAASVGGLAGMITTIDVSELSTFRAEPSVG
jgi:hypothetical protein